jgi:toxin ParE1/3/4
LKSIQFSPAAKRDLDSIWHYTEERWGTNQAVTYVQLLRDACFSVASGQHMTRPVDIRQGYRKTNVGSHVIFFRESNNDQLVVLRILHQRMDVSRHL